MNINLIYVLKHKNEVVYVGRTKNIKRRMQQHKSEGVKIYDSFEIVKEVEDLKRAKRIEDLLIKKYDCEYNKSNNEYGAYISFKEMMSILNVSEDELDEMLFKKRINPIFNENYKKVTLDILLNKDFTNMFRKKVI